MCMIIYECTLVQVCVYGINRHRRRRWRRWRQCAQTIIRARTCTLYTRKTYTYLYIYIFEIYVCVWVRTVCDQIICIIYVMVGAGVGRPNIIIRVKPRDGPLFLAPDRTLLHHRESRRLTIVQHQCWFGCCCCIFFFLIGGSIRLSWTGSVSLYPTENDLFDMVLLLLLLLYIFRGTRWI